jgi:hypothetical protein
MTRDLMGMLQKKVFPLVVAYSEHGHRHSQCDAIA